MAIIVGVMKAPMDEIWTHLSKIDNFIHEMKKNLYIYTFHKAKETNDILKRS